MLYARFMYPDYGYAHNQRQVKDAGLKIRERYAVKDVDMGQSSTRIVLDGFSGNFNSVHFEFDEDGVPIDIFRDARWNPYIRRKK